MGDLLQSRATVPDGAQDVISSWRSFVPEAVVRMLHARPSPLPIAGTELTDAVVLFADVAGFTPMSEALTQTGSYGTEQLTRILNDWFGRMAGHVSHYGGSVADFGGDALIGTFGYGRRSRQATVRRALRCALDMQAAMAEFQTIETRAGIFGLAMKLGVASGPLLLAVMGDPAVRLECVLAGQALNDAVAAEHHAGRGEVVVNEGLLEDGLGIEVLDWRGRWRVAGRVRRRVAPVRQAPPALVNEDLAGRLVPFMHPAIVERLRSGRRDLVNEHRKVTVAFVGLPDLSADDPRAVAALQAYLAAAVRVIDRYDGHLLQVTTGDKGSLLLVCFGAPLGHEDDEERAVHCSLELLGLPGGPFRAGVTTGLVYCGEIGSDLRRAYRVIGDSVNLAARLMQAAEPGQLLVDRETQERVSRTAIQDRLEPVTVKGKTGPIDVWAVRSVLDGAGVTAREPVSATSLVGRQHEAAQAVALAERALGGSGQVICLTGEGGIGKSRLGAEVMRSARRLGFTVFGGACRSYGTTTSYLVWRSVWRDLLELDTTLALEAQQVQLTARVARRDGGSGQRAALLAPVVNLPMPESELTSSVDPQTQEELLRSLLLDCLRDRARGGPLLLVLEDCQWIDPASQALLEFLARRVAAEPVLILVMTRQDAVASPLASLSLLTHFTEIQLTELSSADAEQLLLQRLRWRYGAAAAPSPEVIRQLTERGEGNPLYLEELVSFLHARGVDPSDGRAVAALHLPDGLQRLAMARIDQLSEGEKATVKVASVIGRRFRAWWISRAYPAVGPPEAVARHLERLAELDLTPRRAAAPEPDYAFKHAITQEAAYESLTFQMRQVLHERVGLLIEESYHDRLAQYVDVLAHHYGRSQRVDKQLIWLRAAGDSARSAFANEAAIDYYERLLPLLPRAQASEVLVQLGAVWQLTGRWTEAEHAYRQAMEDAEQAGRREVLAASERHLGDLFMYTQSYTEALRWLTRAAQEFEQLDDQTGLSRALDRITFALHQQGRYDEAKAVSERHLALASEAGDLSAMSIALNHTGLVHLNTGDTAAALALLQQALDIAVRAGDRVCELHAANNLAIVHLRRGDHPQAVTCWHQALSVAQEIGHRQVAGLAVGNIGEVYLEQGDYARAIKCFVRSLRVAVELGDWTSVANRLASMGTTLAAQGRDRQAERLFSRAIELARMVDASYILSYSLLGQAQIHARSGRLEVARRLSQEALEIADRNHERDIQVRSHLLLVTVQSALGRLDKSAAVRRLRALEGASAEPQERAAILAALWQLDPSQEATRKTAGDLYRALCERTPSVEYREAYERLTGVTLPAGPPLPPLPEGVEGEPADVEGMLRQVDLVAPAQHELGLAAVAGGPRES